MSKLISEVGTSIRLTETKQLVSTAIEDLRNMSRLLNTDFIHHNSLKEVLEQQVQSIRNTGEYSVEFIIIGIDKQLIESKRIVVFRVFQEIINNIIKHAQADKILIEISYLDAFIGLQIHDNGIGFDSSNILKSTNNGLRNVKKRIDMVEGTIKITSTSNEGTSVEITVPYGSNE
jgi:signal transduction histidine kinase